MRDLTPVRLTGGGTQLVLVDGEGVEYAVPIARVHQVLGNARGVQERAESATGTTSATPTQGIRKGKRWTREGPEDGERTASSRHPDPDPCRRVPGGRGRRGGHVRREGDDLRRASARRARPHRPQRPVVVRAPDLGRAVVDGPHARPVRRARLREEGVDPESVDWDAWRRDDGRWTLVATYHHDGEPGVPVSATTSRATSSRPTTTRVAGWSATAVRRPRAEGEGHQPAADAGAAVRRGAAARRGRDRAGPGGPLPVAAPAVHDHPDAPEPEAVSGDADWIAPDKGHHGTPLHASAWVDGPEETLAHPEPEAAEPAPEPPEAEERASRLAVPRRRDEDGPPCPRGTRSCSVEAAATRLPVHGLLRHRCDRVHRPAPRPGARRQPPG